MNVVAIFAHPDDAALACAGTLAIHAQQGDQILVIDMTSGEVGGSADVREREDREALDLLGVNEIQFWRKGDGVLQVTRDLVTDLRELVERSGADLVYTHFYDDSHQDHRATYDLVISALRGYPTSLFLGETPSTRGFSPHLYVDIGRTVQTKWDCLSLHKSQFDQGRIDFEFLRMVASYRGYHAGVQFAEAFQLGSLVLK